LTVFQTEFVTIFLMECEMLVIFF